MEDFGLSSRNKFLILYALLQLIETYPIPVPDEDKEEYEEFTALYKRLREGLPRLSYSYERFMQKQEKKSQS